MLAIVEKFQRKDNENFKLMVQRSDIVKSRTIPVKKLNLYNDEKRKRSLILLIITFLYSMITKIVLGDFSFDFLVVLNILLFVTDFYLRVNGNSIWAWNHFDTIKIFELVNKFLVTSIFFLTTILQLEELLGFVGVHSVELEAISAQCSSTGEELWKIFLYILKKKPIFTISFVYSIIMFIPILLYFIKSLITNFLKGVLFAIVSLIPFLGIFLLIKWILNARIFKEYSLLNDETCLINYRKPKYFLDSLMRILGRIFVTVLVVVLQFGVLLYFYW